MVLVTHEGQGEKPRERRGTDGLVRWKGVWREQELWFVPKEATARWGSALFTDELLLTGRGKQVHMAATEHFFFISGAKQA